MSITSPKLQDTKGSDWDAIARNYKRFSTGPSTQATKSLLASVDTFLPFSHATGILDNGCGPGPIISAIIETHGAEIPESTTLLAADFSQGMVDEVNATKARGIEASNETWKRVGTKILNAMDMQGIPDGSQSHVTAGWVYFMTPDPRKCLSETLRILKPGGVLGCTSWKGSQWLDAMNVFGEFKPDVTMPKMPEAWASVEGVRRELEVAGFEDVRSEEVTVEMPFEDVGVLTKMLLYEIPMMKVLTNNLSEAEKEELEQMIAASVKKSSAEHPGKLLGVALVGLGRKKT
nr:hypothetical protein B0A51_10555 [Rachicladosporium sp. CCFEE 5018]